MQRLLIALLGLSSVSSYAQLPVSEVPVRETGSYRMAELISFGFDSAPEDLSGLALRHKDGKTELLSVLDTKSDEPTVIRLFRDGGEYVSGTLYQLSTFDGYMDYYNSVGKRSRDGKKYHVFDLEAIASCGDTLYIADERVRRVLELDTVNKRLRSIYDFNQVPGMRGGGANAGIEGVAVDCARKILYVAHERSERFIVSYDLKSDTVGQPFVIPPSERFEQVMRAYNATNPRQTLGPDFSDLTFDGGYLYALERNAYEIAKIDPSTKKVVDRLYFGNVSFQSQRGSSHNLRTLYRTGEPFGLAEGLTMDSKKIYVALDNNHNPLNSDTSDLSAESPQSSLVFEIMRPAQF